MPPRIFISYRRDDAAGDAGRLADHMNRRFGHGQVFLDIDTIDPGTDFVQVLHASLKETSAVLVVIGQRWTSASEPGGIRRLDEPNDFVRLEVEAALNRDILVVPVLVQGARMPRAEDLPPALASLATRQAVTLDHAEFHDDAERLCNRLESLVGANKSTWPAARRWWPAAAAVVLIAVGIAGYVFLRGGTSASTTGTTTASSNASDTPPTPPDAANTPRVQELVAEATAQRRRNQFTEALATLSSARERAPGSAEVRQLQEDVAMDWIRNVRVDGGKGSFGDAIKPALAVVDTGLATATGSRRADLLAHTGWATFLLWRDGDRRLTPVDSYREALSIDPGNPYANAMLAHWTLFQDHANVETAAKLFDTAVRSGRDLDAVRTLQWAAYSNADTSEANVERIRLADTMRRNGEKLNARQAQALWGPYYFSMRPSQSKDRQTLLDAVPPDDHISTLGWAFEEYAGKDDSRRQAIRYYTALLNAKAGRTDQAITDLRAMEKELAQSPGSLQDAVLASLQELQPGAKGGRRGRPR
jgi:tetratricopeptide (TPR) repeat protein